MKARWVGWTAVVVSAALLLATALGGACKSDSCTKDTDCEMPLICVAEACVPAGTQQDVPGRDDGGPGDTDTPPTDADGDADTEDGPGEAVEDGDAPDGPDAETADDAGGCTTVTSTPLNVIASAADGDERAAALRSGTGFLFFGRPPGPMSADALRFQRFGTDGAAVTAAMWTLSSVEISPSHPIVELPDGSFATAFAVPSGTGTGIWVKNVPSTGVLGEIPRQVPATDASSGEPTITYDGTDVIVAWTHNTGSAVEVRAQHFTASTGEAIGSYVTLASGPSGTKEPRLVWATGGTRHALAYFNGADGALHVLFLDGALTITNDFPLTPAASESVVGYPALVWNGTVFGLAWETRGTGSAAIHFATFLPDTAPAPGEPLSATPLSASETGQLALAWGDTMNEWGLAWRYSQPGRTGIALARLDASTFAVKEGPVDLRSETTAGFNPSLAYNAGFYMVVWTEQPGSGSYPVYEATRGCRP
jgi:hypothetical protein